MLAFALIGLAFAGSASYVHYKLLTQPNYVSPCDINARFNCSEVYLSQYGAIRGVPVAIGGVIFFAIGRGIGKPNGCRADRLSFPNAFVEAADAAVEMIRAVVDTNITVSGLLMKPMVTSQTRNKFTRNLVFPSLIRYS